MLLKCSGSDTTSPSRGKGKLSRGGTVMRMTMSTGSTMTSRVHRKVIRIPSKRHPGKGLPGKLVSRGKIHPGKIHPGKIHPGKKLPALRQNPTHCDNSNDSGLGFDPHPESASTSNNLYQAAVVSSSTSSSINTASSRHVSSSTASSTTTNIRRANVRPDEPSPAKRIKTENSSSEDSDIEDSCSKHTSGCPARVGVECCTVSDAGGPSVDPISGRIKLVASTIARNAPRPPVRRAGGPAVAPVQPGTVTSRDGKYQLQILAQPEQQHRARYQTEGSRGAVKDRSGNGFPIVKLTGYKKPAALEIFIGTDIGRVAPHMFYQACKVSGKNSTPCIEKKHEGTIVIEIELKPETEMSVTCDCVGILKERNVDVEHRFPDQMAPRSKKKSTRCRMVFRTQLELDDGTTETLQICSQQIICTQPPGVPEICKKSLTSCPADGGLELYILGKNFLKDTRVIFQARRSASPHHSDEYDVVWEESVVPDKEYLQQTHLCCVVPPFAHRDIVESTAVHLLVTSSNKKSESHSFMYTPNGAHTVLTAATTRGYSTHSPRQQHPQQSNVTGSQDARYSDVTSNPIMIWNPALNNPASVAEEIDSGMMPPPTLLPLSVRRPSQAGMLCAVDQQMAASMLKAELMDENSQGSQDNIVGLTADAMERMSANDNSMDGSPPADLRFNGPVQQQAPPQRRVYRKHSIDMMDSSAMMVNGAGSSDGMCLGTRPIVRNGSNSMSAFDARMTEMMQMEQTASDVVDLRIKQESINLAAQIQQLKNEAHLLHVVQAHSRNPSVTKYLAEAQNQQRQHVVDSVAVSSLFSAQPNPNPTQQDMIFTQDLNHMSNQMNGVNKTAAAAMDQSIMAHNMMITEPPQSNATATMAQMMAFSNPGQPINMMNPNTTSPLSQDIILNSQPAVTLNTPLSILTGPPIGTVSSDIILNPTVSPSMMCTNSSDTSNVILPSVQVSSVMAGLVVPEQIHIPRSPVAVKNMILNAAADILSSQPSNISPETTISALISLNSSPLINTNPQQQPTQQQASDVDQLMMTTQAPAAATNPMLQQQQSTLDALNNPMQQQPQQSVMQTQNMFGDNVPQQMAVSNILPVGGPSHQQTILNTMAGLNAQQQQQQQQQQQHQQQHQMQEFLNDFQKIHHINAESLQQHAMDTGVSQESLLQAVALVRNELPKDLHPIQQAAALTEVLHQQQIQQHQQQQQQQHQQQLSLQQQQPPATNIPQDIAIMSDNDLISYINPSCFDQV